MCKMILEVLMCGLPADGGRLAGWLGVVQRALWRWEVEEGVCVEACLAAQAVGRAQESQAPSSLTVSVNPTLSSTCLTQIDDVIKPAEYE